MKVVVVFGSPRSKGNSAFLAEALCREFEKGEAVVVRYFLNSLQYRGCQGCMACKNNSEKCILRDELAEVLHAISEAEIIVLASPVYWGDVTGQMKLLIDRTFSYLKPRFVQRDDKHRLPPGKILVWVQTQAAGEDQHGDIFQRYDSFFSPLGFFAKSFVLRATGLSAESNIG